MAKKTRLAAPINPSLKLLRLRQEVASKRTRTNARGTLSASKADPAMWKVIRDQQTTRMAAIYMDFVKKLNLAPEQAEKLINLLAEDVMENIDHIPAVLQDRIAPAAMSAITPKDGQLCLEARGIGGVYEGDLAAESVTLKGR